VKNVVAGVVAAVLGIVGGTAWRVVTHEPAPVPADSTVTEPAAEPVAAESPPDSVTLASAPTGAADATPAPTRTAVVAPSSTTAAPPSLTGAPAPAGDPSNEDEEPGADQLARIFTAMQPRDAARVLSQLTDSEIRDILVRMGARQAASILSSMDAERAAALSRIVLSGTEATP
jgi:hypothetical protein